MKKIKSLLVLFILGSLLLFSSCSKDDDPTLTKTQLLTQNTWKYSSGTSTNPLVQALMGLLAGTEYVFKTDKTYSVTQLGQSIASGKWEFSSDETKIILDKGSVDESTLEIVTLDGSNLEVKEVDGGFTTTIKYVKK